MNKLLLMIITTATVLLTGCGSSPRSPEADQCMRNTERMSSARWNCLSEASRQSEVRTVQQQRNNREVEELHSLRRRCDGFGFRNGTPEYSQCLMKLQQQDNENRFRAAQVNQEQEKIRQQSLRDFNDAIKPPAFVPVPCPSGMMRNDGMPDGSWRMFLKAEQEMEKPPEGLFAIFKKPVKYIQKQNMD